MPSRQVECGDGVAFLARGRLPPGHALVTSLPDRSELSINARLPYKEQYLSSLQAQQSSLGQQESMLRQRADAASATLDELNEELARLDRQVVADRRSNRKLRYNANSTSRRVKQLKVELASLQERQAESSSTGRVDPELEAQVRRKKQEVEALLKVVIQQ